LFSSIIRFSFREEILDGGLSGWAGPGRAGLGWAGQGRFPLTISMIAGHAAFLFHHLKTSFYCRLPSFCRKNTFSSETLST
jgi:hypothetical protein